MTKQSITRRLEIYDFIEVFHYSCYLVDQVGFYVSVVFNIGIRYNTLSISWWPLCAVTCFLVYRILIRSHVKRSGYSSTTSGEWSKPSLILNTSRAQIIFGSSLLLSNFYAYSMQTKHLNKDVFGFRKSLIATYEMDIPLSTLLLVLGSSWTCWTHRMLDQDPNQLMR